MSQKEVLDFLENNKNMFFTAKEIAKNFSMNSNSIRVNLMRLRKWNFIKTKFNPGINSYLYSAKD
ncbi:MAG: HTH domain-containing protein [Nanoarchaeota archaeon]